MGIRNFLPHLPGRSTDSFGHSFCDLGWAGNMPTPNRCGYDHAMPGPKRKKTRMHVIEADDHVRGALVSNDESRVPCSLVVRRGRVKPVLVKPVYNIRSLGRIRP